MVAPLASQWTVAHGESLDISIDVPTYDAPGDDPRTDGSVWSLAFKRARGDVEAFLMFTSRAAVGSIAAGDYADGKLTLSFTASKDAVWQAPAGAYVGDLFRERPRPGGEGTMRTRVAIVSLTVEGATES